MIIDGENAVLGRLSSYAAKQLMKGEPVTVINAEKVIITGDPALLLERYLHRRQRGGPHHGPFFPKKPDLILRRTVRGMLPYKKSRGMSALRRLRVHIGVPQEIVASGEAKKMPASVKTRYMTLEKLTRNMGWSQ